MDDNYCNNREKDRLDIWVTADREGVMKSYRKDYERKSMTGVTSEFKVMRTDNTPYLNDVLNRNMVPVEMVKKNVYVSDGKTCFEKPENWKELDLVMDKTDGACNVTSLESLSTVKGNPRGFDGSNLKIPRTKEEIAAVTDKKKLDSVMELKAESVGVVEETEVKDFWNGNNDEQVSEEYMIKKELVQQQLNEKKCVERSGKNKQFCLGNLEKLTNEKYGNDEESDTAERYVEDLGNKEPGIKHDCQKGFAKDPLRGEQKACRNDCNKCRHCCQRDRNIEFENSWDAFETHMTDMADQAFEDDEQKSAKEVDLETNKLENMGGDIEGEFETESTGKCLLPVEEMAKMNIGENGDDDMFEMVSNSFDVNEMQRSVDEDGENITVNGETCTVVREPEKTIAGETKLFVTEGDNKKLKSGMCRRDLISRKKEKFQKKSLSSNTILKRVDKKEVKVSKVKVVKTAQIVETRAKSHHFLWTIPDPGSQKLNWHKPPLTVLVVKKIYDESVLGPFRDLILWLIEERKMIVFVEANVLEDGILADDITFKKYRGKLQTFKQDKDDLTDKIDFIICLGGDGTLLHASTLFQKSCPPVMAFHQGSLGFLTPFTFHNFESQVTQVLEGNAPLLLRYRLKCVICKENSELGKVPRIKNIDSSSECAKSQILVLNEVVVDRGSSSFICNIDVFVEDRLVTSVQGDGIIISTPTGSTAYAVAAGASMIHPNVPAIMITPICPHSLSFRPIVVPAGVELKIMVSPEARNSAMVSFDGRNRQEINQGDSVRITTAQFPLPAVCAKDQIEDWFERLAECLHWNVRKTQKMLDSSRNTSDSSISSTTTVNSDVFHEDHSS